MLEGLVLAGRGHDARDRADRGGIFGAEGRDAGSRLLGGVGRAAPEPEVVRRGGDRADREGDDADGDEDDAAAVARFGDHGRLRLGRQGRGGCLGIRWRRNPAQPQSTGQRTGPFDDLRTAIRAEPSAIGDLRAAGRAKHPHHPSCWAGQLSSSYRRLDRATVAQYLRAHGHPLRPMARDEGGVARRGDVSRFRSLHLD